MAIITKTIGDLQDLRFFVPSYQRGYRWTEYEVNALLDDVNEFLTEGGKQYCIQPLIVKAREDGSFEVVDGQQRLTTIYIFMKIAEEKTEYIPFYLEFETRKNSQSFLSSLAPRGDIDSVNIDYHHITEARETINNWLDERKNRYIAVNDLFKRFIESVIFIWYELPQDADPIRMFTKVNLGKIPLTSAELIKALLLNKDNFGDSGNDTYKKQTEISLAWDRIEQGLRNDSFWYFLNEKEESGTRIDMLFKLLALEYNKQLPTRISEKQNYFPFLVFSAVFEKRAALNEKEEFVKELWNDVEMLYSEFSDWYDDLDKYHIIGYMVATGVNITELFSLTRGKRKSAVTRGLLDRARKTISGNIDLDTLSELSLGYGYNNVKIKNLLLLFNIATLVCKSEKQYRFPFDIFKGETNDKMKWDIEHIHATADETDEADDILWNLALLDSRTNRSPRYAKKTFQEKRDVILDRESKGLFVPLCTKNVFLKAYSDDLSDMSKWTENDKLDYLTAIDETLVTFFEGGFDA